MIARTGSHGCSDRQFHTDGTQSTDTKLEKGLQRSTYTNIIVRSGTAFGGDRVEDKPIDREISQDLSNKYPSWSVAPYECTLLIVVEIPLSLLQNVPLSIASYNDTGLDTVSI